MGPVYDVTRSETFESLEHIWINEWEMYSTVEAAVKMVVGNKVDLVRATDLCDQETGWGSTALCWLVVQRLLST